MCVWFQHFCGSHWQTADAEHHQKLPWHKIHQQVVGRVMSTLKGKHALSLFSLTLPFMPWYKLHSLMGEINKTVSLAFPTPPLLHVIHAALGVVCFFWWTMNHTEFLVAWNHWLLLITSEYRNSCLHVAQDDINIVCTQDRSSDDNTDHVCVSWMHLVMLTVTVFT